MVAEFKLDEEESVPEDVNTTLQGESHEVLSNVSDGDVLVLVWNRHLHPIVCHWGFLQSTRKRIIGVGVSVTKKIFIEKDQILSSDCEICFDQIGYGKGTVLVVLVKVTWRHLYQYRHLQPGLWLSWSVAFQIPHRSDSPSTRRTVCPSTGNVLRERQYNFMFTVLILFLFIKTKVLFHTLA